MLYPRQLMPSEIVWRGLRPQWIVGGKIQLVAFIRRPLNSRTGNPDVGLSVGLAAEQNPLEFLNTIPIANKKGWCVGQLLVESIEAIPDAPLRVEQDKPRHANILGTPLEAEDSELAVTLAQKLIAATDLIP